MPFIKKHYEKILLSIVLLGLAAAAAALPLEVARVEDYLTSMREGVVRTDPKPFQPVDLSANKAVVTRLEGDIQLNFSEPHNIFNPVQWQKKSDGSLLKIPTSDHIGPAALVVTDIDELMMTVQYDRAEGTAENAKYYFTITREGETNPRKSVTATLRTPRNANFEILEVIGPKEDPAGFKLLLKDEQEPIVVTKDQPHSRITGYAAQLKYPPHNQSFSKPFRVKDTLRLTGDSETYKIVAINRNEVTVAADSTQKRTTVKFETTPQLN